MWPKYWVLNNTTPPANAKIADRGLFKAPQKWQDLRSDSNVTYVGHQCTATYWI